MREREYEDIPSTENERVEESLDEIMAEIGSDGYSSISRYIDEDDANPVRERDRPGEDEAPSR